MATTTQAVTIEILGEQLYKANEGIQGLKGDMTEIKDQLAGLERDVGAIKRHLGVPDDA